MFQQPAFHHNFQTVMLSSLGDPVEFRHVCYHLGAKCFLYLTQVNLAHFYRLIEKMTSKSFIICGRHTYTAEVYRGLTRWSSLWICLEMANRSRDFHLVSRDATQAASVPEFLAWFFHWWFSLSLKAWLRAKANHSSSLKDSLQTVDCFSICYTCSDRLSWNQQNWLDYLYIVATTYAYLLSLNPMTQTFNLQTYSWPRTLHLVCLHMD